MAMTATLYKETMFMGKRAKFYKLVSDGSDTAVDILPGPGYTIGPIGNYTGYTVSSGTFTVTLPAGTNLSYRDLMFLEG
jgi:hypothetical protein